VLTSAVVVFGSLTSANPRKNLAAPTPPASTTIESELLFAITTIERTQTVVC
jgi:hypothetical protein